MGKAAAGYALAGAAVGAMAMGKKAPSAPDMSGMVAASNKQAELSYKTSQEQLAWAKEQWGQTQEMLGPTLDIQRKIMENNAANAMKDRARYETQYQPLEENLIREFQGYDTPERRAKESGEAMAQVRSAHEAANERNKQNLASFGVDEMSIRGQALDKGVAALQAAQEAGAGNVARKGVQDTGRALRAEAINIGRGYPSQVAGSYGMSLQAGNSAMANQFGAVNSGVGSMGTGLQWGGMGLNGTGQAANIASMGYQNRLAGYEAQGDPMELVGMGLAAYGGAGGFNEGGEVAPEQEDGSVTGRDSVSAALTPGEYVFPKEAVNFYGTEKLNKLVAKAREAQGIPEPRQRSAMPSRHTSIRMNDGGSVDDEIAAIYARNQAMGASAADFREDLNAKRDADEAEQNQSMYNAAAAGKKWKEGKDKEPPKPKTPPKDSTNVRPLPEPTTPTNGIAQPSGATVYPAGPQAAPIGAVQPSALAAPPAPGLGAVPAAAPAKPKSSWGGTTGAGRTIGDFFKNIA